MKKRNILIFLIITIFLAAIRNVWAKEETVIHFGKWDAVENSSGLTISAYHGGNEEELSIPEFLGGKPVTALGKELFKNNYKS